MIAKEFIDNSGANLTIEHAKTNIIFKTDNKNIKKDYYVHLYFSGSVIKEIVKYLESISREIWKDFKPKEADSISSDYEEYYDRSFDSNGYLTVAKDNGFKIEKPAENCAYMYKFNKRRMESFIYDLHKQVAF